jgi:glycosyltransferase involved in cell wall biosynthesis
MAERLGYAVTVRPRRYPRSVSSPSGDTAILPSISTVIAVRNGALTVERTLNSLFEQRYERLEIVVMDGASTDGTPEILARHSSRIAFWHSEPDRGIYDAWNKALAHVSGDWVFFLGADDRMHAPDVLRRLAPTLAAAADHSRVVYGAIDIVDPDGRSTRFGEPWSIAGPAFRMGLMLPHAATFHHRSLFEQRGLFDSTYQIAGDYELLLRELLDHDAVSVPGLIVADVAGGGISDRPETDGRRAREKHRARRQHGLTVSPEWRSPEVLKAVTRAWVARTFGVRTMAHLRDMSRRMRGRPAGPAAR